MAICFPRRRVLGLPAWLWVVLPIPLLALGSSLSMFWLPSSLDEPPERAEIFRDLVLITRQGETYRFVPFSEQKGVKPLWAVSVITSARYNLKWDTRHYLPGLFRRQASWTYELTANRFDPDWKDDKLNALTLPAEQIRLLRPLIVAEMNRRDPAAQRGDRLERLLNNGLEEKSLFCPQNAVIALGWLSVPLAFVGLCSMFVRPRRAESGHSDPSMPPMPPPTAKAC
jgi:hypothetical protein